MPFLLTKLPGGRLVLAKCRAGALWAVKYETRSQAEGQIRFYLGLGWEVYRPEAEGPFYVAYQGPLCPVEGVA